MSKAHYECDCGNKKDITFTPGEKPSAPVCENCKKEMKRKFNKVGKGSIIPDDIMYVQRMMSYQSDKK